MESRWSAGPYGPADRPVGADSGNPEVSCTGPQAANDGLMVGGPPRRTQDPPSTGTSRRHTAWAMAYCPNKQARYLRVGILRQLERLLREPAACRWVVQAPERVEKLLVRPSRGPSGLGIGGVIPGADAARGIALTVGLAGHLHPQISIKQRYAKQAAEKIPGKSCDQTVTAHPSTVNAHHRLRRGNESASRRPGGGRESRERRRPTPTGPRSGRPEKR